jgi:hypothetical protein
MATQQYKVQKGDTLGALAKKLGVGVNDFSGYRSGDPNKIFEGETISYGPKADTGSSSYVDEVKSQLGDTGGEKTDTSKDPYGLASIRTKIDDTTTKRDSAFAELKDISTKTFNDEYSKRGLEEKKTKLASIDSEITAEKAKRDEAIAKVRSNPGLSAAQMTGDIKKLVDYQNDVINTKIAERNSVASEYNTGLAEIDKIVQNTVKDKTLDYGYYDSVLKDLTGQVSDYTKAYRDDLKDETQADQFDRQLSQALEIATMNANKKGSDSSNLQLKSDPRTGDPLYWFDPDTGEITYINADGGEDSGGGFDDLEKAVETQQTSSGKKWYNPLTWFN